MLRCFMYSRFFFLRKCTLLSFFAGLFVWGNIVPVFHSVWLLKKKKNLCFQAGYFVAKKFLAYGSLFVQVLFTPIRHHQHWRWLIKLPVLPFTITRLRRRKMFPCQAVWFVRKRVGKKMKMSFSLILRLFVIWVWKKMNLRGRGKIFFFPNILLTLV